ncbi:MAG: sulfite exporter TauE/SafE family protein [Chloroflexi bacterium]|nr:MAG: sulfite exporter TauE/SafE family protein [Chloroflexota bacterium]
MLGAFFLGLAGSLGHCAGMCGGVTLLLSRRGLTQGWKLVLLHVGRMMMYGLLGGVVYGLGWVAVTTGTAVSGAHSHSHHHALQTAVPNNNGLAGLSFWQGGLALITAVLAMYMTLALLGRVPSPELFVVRLTKLWGRIMRRVAQPERGAGTPLTALAIGFLWGMLPCGLVLTALVTTAVAPTPAHAVGRMLAFGAGTLPVNLGLGWISQRELLTPATRMKLRPLAALFIFLFGVQMAMRGLASWGVVSHTMIGELVLW